MRQKLIKVLNSIIFRTKLYKLLSTKHKVVLLYHRVNQDKLIQDYYLKGIFTTTENFKKQMQWLSNSNRRNKVIITFDDGYEDNYKYAFPILKEYNLRAIFFVTINFIEKQQNMWIDILNNYAVSKKLTMGEFKKISKKIKRLPIKKRNEFLQTIKIKNNLENDKSMDWNQLKEMEENGHIIANHTLNHPNLSQESKRTILKEIRDTKKIIEKKLGKKDIYFAYPDGDIGDKKETLNILEEIGYKYAFTTKRGIWKEDKDDKLLINRIPIYYWDDLATFVNKIHGINIEDNFSIREFLLYILEIIGIKEWLKRKLKF